MPSSLDDFAADMLGTGGPRVQATPRGTPRTRTIPAGGARVPGCASCAQLSAELEDARRTIARLTAELQQAGAVGPSVEDAEIVEADGGLSSGVSPQEAKRRRKLAQLEEQDGGDDGPF